MQAEARKVCAQGQGCQIGVLHPDDAQQPHEAVWIRGRWLLRSPSKLHAHFAGKTMEVWAAALI